MFQNLSFEAREGSCTIFKGANGSGKSTLLKILAGLRKADQGRVNFNGKSIYKEPGDYYNELSYISHKNAMKAELSVLENLDFWCEKSFSELSVAALAAFELYDYSEYKFSELSEGLKRRVALARLLCAPKKIWLLDEPTNNLDQESIAMFSELIKFRMNSGGIIIIASHIDFDIAELKQINLRDFI